MDFKERVIQNREATDEQEKADQLPESGYGLAGKQKGESKEEFQRKSEEPVITNTGIGPAEDPDIPAGMDVDAASG